MPTAATQQDTANEILANTMQPNGAESWSNFLSSPAAQAALLQFGLSMMMGTGSDLPLMAQFGAAGLDAARAANLAQHPEFNPMMLEAQQTQAAAMRPYWNMALEQQQHQNQMEAIGEQGKVSAAGREQELENTKKTFALRSQQTAETEASEKRVIGARAAAESANTKESDKLARGRITAGAAADIVTAERKAALDLGTKVWEKQNGGVAMTSDQVQLFKTFYEGLEPLGGFQPDSNSPVSEDEQRVQHVKDTTAKALNMLAGMRGGAPGTTVVVPLKPSGPMPPVVGP